MSDEFDPEVMEAARTIALRLGAIDRCEVCGATWTTGKYDHDHEDSVAELVRAARQVIAEDEALDRFDDDGGLRHALFSAVGDTAVQKDCPH